MVKESRDGDGAGGGKQVQKEGARGPDDTFVHLFMCSFLHPIFQRDSLIVYLFIERVRASCHLLVS